MTTPETRKDYLDLLKSYRLKHQQLGAAQNRSKYERDFGEIMTLARECDALFAQLTGFAPVRVDRIPRILHSLSDRAVDEMRNELECLFMKYGVTHEERTNLFTDVMVTLSTLDHSDVSIYDRAQED